MGCLMWNPNPSLLREITLSLWSFPAIDNHEWSMFFPFGVTISFFYSSHCCPFTFCCGDPVHQIFKGLLEGIILYVVVDLLCLCKEVGSGASCAAILNSLQWKWDNVLCISQTKVFKYYSYFLRIIRILLKIFVK